MQTTARCPYCQASVAMPTETEPSRCPRCGGSILLTDLTDVQAGLPDPREAAPGAIATGLPPRVSSLREDPVARMDIRVPVEPPTAKSRLAVGVLVISL